MERRIFIVLSSDEEQLPLKLIRIGLLGEAGSHIVADSRIDAGLEIAMAIARHTEVPLIGIMAGRISTRNITVPMIEIISDFTHNNPELKEFLLQNREINKINEIFSFTAAPIMDYSKELEEIFKQEYLSFFYNKKGVNNWKCRKIQQTKFNRQIKRSKWQTCRSQL